jgi:hypothetical protein
MPLNTPEILSLLTNSKSGTGYCSIKSGFFFKFCLSIRNAFISFKYGHFSLVFLEFTFSQYVAPSIVTLNSHGSPDMHLISLSFSSMIDSTYGLHSMSNPVCWHISRISRSLIASTELKQYRGLYIAVDHFHLGLIPGLCL